MGSVLQRALGQGDSELREEPVEVPLMDPERENISSTVAETGEPGCISAMNEWRPAGSPNSSTNLEGPK
jgi:hypothetical protein